MATKKTTEPESKPEKKTATTKTPRKRVVTTTVTEEVQEPETTVEPEVLETAPEAITLKEIPKDIEKEAVTIWGRIKDWKWFWWVVVAIGLILVFLAYTGINNYQINAEKIRVENAKQRAEELKLIIRSLKGDIIKKDTLIIQSQNEATDASNDRKDFEKKSEVEHQLNIKKNQQTHETINTTDDERVLDSIINSYVSRTE